MKKWKKICLGLILTLAILLVAGSFYAGNYLVDYALVRAESSPQSADDGKAPEHTAFGNETENKEKEKALFDQWKTTISLIETSIQSEDGLTLKALEYQSNPQSHRYAILVHGYCANKENMQTEARRFSLMGYNILTPDNRAHGESEGTYIGMGWLDRKDLLGWINTIIEKDSQAEILLYGESMGGATVMMTAGEALPSNVKAIIEDCGYTSVYDMFKNQLDYRFGLPEFPFLFTADIMTGLRAGYHFKEASAIEQVKNAKVPMMFIHGSEDNYVPTEMIYEVYEACSTEKQILVIEGAGHGASADVDPELYWSSVETFLQQNMKSTFVDSTH